MIETDKEDKLDRIISMMLEMREELKEYKENMKTIIMENEQLKQQNEKIAKKNEEIKRELESMRNSIEDMEKEKRKCNIVITGKFTEKIEMTHNEMNDELKDFMRKNLDVQVNFKQVRKIGERTCLIELENIQDKQNIMRNKHKLQKIKERIYINNDLSRKDRNKQQQIRIKVKEARSQGKIVKVGNNKIQIDKELWEWNQIKNQLEQSKN